MSVDRFIDVFHLPVLEADQAHAADCDAELARVTEAMCWRNGAAPAHLVFPTPEVIDWFYNGAPTCTMLALNSWTSFACFDSNSVFQVPFRQTEGFESIRAVLVFATESSVRFRARISSITLLDAIATTDGTQSQAGYAVEMHRMHHWALMGSHVGAAFKACTLSPIVTPSELPANRRIAIRPQLKIDEGYFDRVDSGGVVKVYLRSITLFETPSAAVGI